MTAATVVTAKKREAFLADLSESGSVSHACTAAGMARWTAYRLRDRHPTFAQAWEEAVSAAIGRMEEEARRRAVDGTDEPVFYMGDEVGAIRRYSDVLLMFLMKAHKPAMYREKTIIEGGDPTKPVTVAYVNDWRAGQSEREAGTSSEPSGE